MANPRLGDPEVTQQKCPGELCSFVHPSPSWSGSYRCFGFTPNHPHMLPAPSMLASSISFQRCRACALHRRGIGSLELYKADSFLCFLGSGSGMACLRSLPRHTTQLLSVLLLCSCWFNIPITRFGSERSGREWECGAGGTG